MRAVRWVVVSVVACSLLILLGCEETGKPLVITDRDLGRIEQVKVRVGQVVYLRLNENPTTGYRWTLKWRPRHPLELTENKYQPSNPGMIGAGGIHRFTIKAVHPGQVTVTLQHGRPWHGGEREKPKTFKVMVLE